MTKYNGEDLILYEFYSDEFSMIAPDLKTIYNAIVYFNIHEFEIHKDGIMIANGKSLYDDFDKLIGKNLIDKKEEVALLLISNHVIYNNVYRLDSKNQERGE